MSTTFVLGLGLVGAVAVLARLLLPALPLRVARPLSVWAAAAVAIGLAGLAFHCAAMFFPLLTRHLPGATAVMPDIRALGTPSIIWYVVPASLLLVGLRRLHPAGPLGVASALVAVGVTMYDDGPLRVHLAAILAADCVAVGSLAALARPPWSAAPAPQG